MTDPACMPRMRWLHERAGDRRKNLPITFPEDSMKLTTASIKQLVLPPGVADRIFFDDDIGGFGIRLRAGGSASYVVQYDLGGKSRRVTLGPVTLLDQGAARTKAKDLLARV